MLAVQRPDHYEFLTVRLLQTTTSRPTLPSSSQQRRTNCNTTTSAAQELRRPATRLKSPRRQKTASERASVASVSAFVPSTYTGSLITPATGSSVVHSSSSCLATTSSPAINSLHPSTPTLAHLGLRILTIGRKTQGEILEIVLSRGPDEKGVLSKHGTRSWQKPW